jgi:hypothetical protein
MKRIFFADKEFHASFIDKLTNFSAKITQIIEHRNDNKGNFKQSIKQLAESEMPQSFKLCMPIYQGMQPVTFEVQIFLEPRDAAIDFWFESVELAELIESERDRIINEQILLFGETCILEI